jgi:hypothetical protein
VVSPADRFHQNSARIERYPTSKSRTSNYQQVKKEIWALNSQPALCKSTCEILEVFKVN